jgi:GTP pyrophosphokinase
MAFRLIVKTIPQCYQMLGEIHRNYLVIPGRFRDYISTPKNNNYQSLHTSVIGPFNKRIEIQIRTEEMHRVAEFGIAAHSDYKERGSQRTKSSNDYLWINNLVSILENTASMEEFFANSKTEMLSDTVFCITPKGAILSLPKGSSVLDFAYAIHSDVGNHASSAKINGKQVLLRAIVENGDQIEISIDPKQNPTPAWKEFVQTVKAKSAIKKALNALERERIIMIGRSNFYDTFAVHNIQINDDEINLLCKTLKISSSAQMFYAIGTSQFTMRDIITAYNNIKNTTINWTVAVNEKDTQTNNQVIPPIFGLPNLPLLHVNCCSPIPGDKIIGLILDENCVEIHIEKCSIAKNKEKEQNTRMIDLSWQAKAYDTGKKYLSKLQIVSIYEPGNLSKIASVIESKKGAIVNLHIGEKIDNMVNLQIEIEVTNISQLIMIIASLRIEPFVNKVIRI